ncbi:MAG: peptide deformylase [Bacteroidales bacterium]|nr:peptide deformylase [Bacteroidales bacterium]MBO4566758.1 peptide deformylase [Bacteroidales bacterium]
MIQPIYLYGSEVLRAKAAPADLSDKEGLSKLVQDLRDTLERSEGCGLAAPQIGVSLRVLIVDGDVMADVYPYLKGFRRVMINPEVLEESAEQCEYEEGCLSVPGVYCNVRRPVSMTVRYRDENLAERTETFDKFGCRMVQHEMSHLDGVLFTDLVAPIRRKMIGKKLINISHGKVATRYNAKVK